MAFIIIAVAIVIIVEKLSKQLEKKYSNGRKN
jgi:Flp pilus assembly pilin Flp